MSFEQVVQVVYGVSALIGAGFALWLAIKVGKSVVSSENLMLRLATLVLISLVLFALFSFVAGYFPGFAVVANGVALFFLGIGAGFCLYSLHKLAFMSTSEVQKAQ